MFTVGMKINVEFEDTIVNAIYVGNESAFCRKLGLHEFKDLKGNLCLTTFEKMEAGHKANARKSVP